jgi:hypothetical protein
VKNVPFWNRWRVRLERNWLAGEHCQSSPLVKLKFYVALISGVPFEEHVMSGRGQKRTRVRDRRFALKRTLSGSIILDLRAVEKAMSTSGKVTVECDGRIYAATYTVEGDMVHVKTHTERRSVALSGKSPEDIARRELEEIVEASRRH